MILAQRCLSCKITIQFDVNQGVECALNIMMQYLLRGVATSGVAWSNSKFEVVRKNRRAICYF
jgi:hypothetical protein